MLHLFPLSSFLAASPSLVVASALSTGVSPSTPSVGVSSAGFSGSLITVGAATVAITKSLSVIVGITFSGNLTEEIFNTCAYICSFKINNNFI